MLKIGIKDEHNKKSSKSCQKISGSRQTWVRLGKTNCAWSSGSGRRSRWCAVVKRPSWIFLYSRASSTMRCNVCNAQFCSEMKKGQLCVAISATRGDIVRRGQLTSAKKSNIQMQILGWRFKCSQVINVTAPEPKAWAGLAQPEMDRCPLPTMTSSIQVKRLSWDAINPFNQKTRVTDLLRYKSWQRQKQPLRF